MANSDDNQQERLLRRLHDREAVIGIVGLGYVGLPLMLRFIEKGYQVILLPLAWSAATATQSLCMLLAQPL